MDPPAGDSVGEDRHHIPQGGFTMLSAVKTEGENPVLGVSEWGLIPPERFGSDSQIR